MSLIVLLDSGPLGMITNPLGSPENEACSRWLRALLTRNARVVIPEIADYEVRRELLRADKLEGLARLDTLKKVLDYRPITTPIMVRAASFWATARKRARPTADDKALDGDVILAAQAAAFENGQDQVVIATTNVQHLSLFVNARLWREIE
jgi:predicted nucleic acid-binding protein